MWIRQARKLVILCFVVLLIVVFILFAKDRTSLAWQRPAGKVKWIQKGWKSLQRLYAGKNMYEKYFFSGQAAMATTAKAVMARPKMVLSPPERNVLMDAIRRLDALPKLKNANHKTEIRQTWASVRQHLGFKYSFIFVLGTQSDAEAKEQAYQENRRYQDMLQAEFNENNDTEAGILGIQWANTHCSGAKLVIKTKDDIFLNVFKLAVLYKNLHFRFSDHVGLSCPVIHELPLPRDLPKSLLKQHPFTRYCDGSLYAMAHNAATILAIASTKIAPPAQRHLSEDMYITGFLAAELGIKLSTSPALAEIDYPRLSVDVGRIRTYLLVHSGQAAWLSELWSELLIQLGRLIDQVQFEPENKYDNGRFSGDPNPLFWNEKNPHNFSYTLNNEGICQNTNLLVFVLSATQHFEIRQLIRGTWASIKHYKGFNITTVFLLGKSQDPLEQPRIVEESRVHGDIIQEDFIDTYKNLTLKSIMGLKWAAIFCSQADLILKTDDDVFVNVYNILDFHTKNYFRLKSGYGIYCPLAKFENKFRLPERRSRLSRVTYYRKWTVTHDEYPAKFFPPHCDGMGYLMTPQSALKLYSISEKTHYFSVEDVYITGVLRRRAKLRIFGTVYGAAYHTFIYASMFQISDVQLIALMGGDRRNLRKIFQRFKQEYKIIKTA